MSSWANRHIPRRRDISQIPEELRPHIVQRFERPQVILSESFQPKEEDRDIMNEIIYPSSDFVMDRQQYVTRKIESTFSSAKELKYNDKSYVFVILRNINNTKDNDLWITSYNSIRKFYTNQIIIIDDNSTINTVNGKLVNCDVISSQYNGAGEILPYYYFLQHKWADRMIFMHDSMYLNRAFRNEELENAVCFHWDFYSTEKVNRNQIKTYLSLLKNSEALSEFFGTPNSFWKGCFGAATMIDLAVVQSLEEKYSLFSSLVLSIRNRKERETFERIFGVILFFEELVTAEDCSNFGNITEYPSAFYSNTLTFDIAQQAVHQAKYNTAILKVWRGR